MNQHSRVKFDLLGLKPVRSLVFRAGFPVLLQTAALAVFVWLVVVGFGIGPGMESESLMTLRKTNLTTLVIWGLWWPGMIAVALFFGRAWCTVCPMELVNRIGDTVARRVGWPRARLGKFLRAGWLIIIAYLALQLLVAGFSIHRVPHYTSIFLLVLVGGALVTGLIFRESRSFCRSFCPAEALLSVYGRYTPVQLEVHDQAVCSNCTTKDCVDADYRYRFDKRSCPSLLKPYHRAQSDGCVLCLQCAKVCPHGNVGFGFVSGDAPVRKKGLLLPFEAAFVMIALGFVSHEVIGEIEWLDGLFHTVPTSLNALFPAVSFGWIEALWFLVLFPLAVWTIISGIGYIAGHRMGIRSLFLAAATGAAPVVAIAHLAKAAAKISSWGGFLPLALRDQAGLATFHRIAEHSLVPPGRYFPLSIVGWIMLAATVLIAYKAWRWAGEVPAESSTTARIGMAASAVLFTAVLTVWAWP